MNHINEKELSDYLEVTREAAGNDKGIESFRIEETDEGKFVLVMALTFKKGDYLLINARKSPRYWPNPIKLYDFIKSLNFPNAPVSVKLNMKRNL